jgi:FkbM family methyltransferase
MSNGKTTTEGRIVRIVTRDVDVSFWVTDPEDLVQSRHMNGSFYESRDLLLLKDHIRPGCVILDIGANIGNHAIFFEKFLHAQEIILIEPHPATIEHLRINIALNRLQHVNESFLGFGLGNEMAIGIMSYPLANPAAARFVPDERGSIRIVPGDLLFAQRIIDFIKIDAEPMGLDVLRGLERVISRCSPDIYIEVGDDHLAEFREWCTAKRYIQIADPVRYSNYANYLIRRSG